MFTKGQIIKTSDGKYGVIESDINETNDKVSVSTLTNLPFIRREYSIAEIYSIVLEEENISEHDKELLILNSRLIRDDRGNLSCSELVSKMLIQ